MEINPTEIKYKSFDNLDGPVITIYKKEAKSIVYQNGKIENFEMAVPTKPVLKSEGQKSEYDHIFYTNSGGDFETIILEITPDQVVLKDLQNDGKKTFINKDIITKIVYQNGKTDYFNVPIVTQPIQNEKIQKSEYDHIFYTNDGGDFQTIILDITADKVLFKDLQNNGKSSSVNKSNVAKIIYQSGKIDYFNTPTTIKSVLKEEIQKPEYDRIFYTNNGGDSEVIILEVTADKIFFKDLQNNSMTKSVYKNSVAKIVYQNGSVQILKDENVLNTEVPQRRENQFQYNNSQGQGLATGSSSSNIGNEDMYLKGKSDANLYYSGYKGAGTGTFLVTFLISPIIGLVPAIACSSTKPNFDHLGIPNQSLAKNSEYYQGYSDRALTIKSKKVWTNFGVGTGILVALVIALAASAR